MIPGVDFYKNMEIQSKQNVGKTVNMKECVKMITLVSLEEIFALQTCIDGEKIDT
jgi:hypothetical protein